MVSVIMPAYNGARYIAESIRSVLDQTHANFELLVVDDGSTDGTGEIVRAIQATDERVKYAFQENRGQAHARNTAIKSARGELLAFLDQDDLWMKEKLELQVEVMSRTGADVVFSDGFIFGEDDAGGAGVSFATVTGKFEGARMFNYLFLERSIPVLSVLLRKAALDKVGLLEEDARYQNSDDYDLWLRLAASGAAFFGMREKLVRYRAHPQQASANKVRMLASELAVLEKHERALPLDAARSSQRFRSLYRELVIALLDEGQVGAARRRLNELLRRDGFRLSTLAQAVLIRTLPHFYKRAHQQLSRARASFSYRVARHVRRAWRLLSEGTSG